MHSQLTFFHSIDTHWWLTASGTGGWSWRDKGKILFYSFLLRDWEKPSWPSTLQIPMNSNACIYFTCDFMLQLTCTNGCVWRSLSLSLLPETFYSNQSSLMAVPPQTDQTKWAGPSHLQGICKSRSQRSSLTFCRNFQRMGTEDSLPSLFHNVLEVLMLDPFPAAPHLRAVNHAILGQAGQEGHWVTIRFWPQGWSWCAHLGWSEHSLPGGFYLDARWGSDMGSGSEMLGFCLLKQNKSHTSIFYYHYFKYLLIYISQWA